MTTGFYDKDLVMGPCDICGDTYRSCECYCEHGTEAERCYMCEDEEETDDGY